MLERLKQPFTLKLPQIGGGRSAGTHHMAGGFGAHHPSRPVVGLDIEPGQVVAATVRIDGALRIDRAVGFPVDPAVMRDGEVSDVEALTAALSSLFAQTGFDRRVRIGIANQRIVVRRLELPATLGADELEVAVRFKAQDEVPMPLDTAVMDYHVVGVAETPNGPRQIVVVVAARREMVDRVVAAARGAGLRVEGVDLSAFAMVRALYPGPRAAEEPVVYLGVSGLTNLAIADGTDVQFTRVLGGGIEEIVAEVAQRCAVPIADARALVGRAELDDPGLKSAPRPPPAIEPAIDELGAIGAESPAFGEEPPLESSIPPNEAPSIAPKPSAPSAGGKGGDQQAAASVVVRDGIRRIAAEVRNSIEFHHSFESGVVVSGVILCGSAVDIPGFDAALARDLNMTVTSRVVPEAVPGATGDVPASRVTIAAGLAVEEVPS